jgi:hypothetical protein
VLTPAFLGTSCAKVRLDVVECSRSPNSQPASAELRRHPWCSRDAQPDLVAKASKFNVRRNAIQATRDQFEPAIRDHPPSDWTCTSAVALSTIALALSRPLACDRPGLLPPRTMSYCLMWVLLLAKGLGRWGVLLHRPSLLKRPQDNRRGLGHPNFRLPFTVRRKDRQSCRT